MKFTINKITEWYEDRHQEAGDSCHMSEGDVMRGKLREYERKVERGEWPCLPFACEAETEGDAIAIYNKMVCDAHYYKASDAEFMPYSEPRKVPPFTLRQMLASMNNDDWIRIRPSKASLPPGAGSRDDILVFKGDLADNDLGTLRKVEGLLDNNVMCVWLDEDKSKVPMVAVSVLDDGETEAISPAAPTPQNADMEAKALQYAEEKGIIEYRVNGRFMEYWTFYGKSEGWYFVRYDLEEGEEVFRGANIPWDESAEQPIPAFLIAKNGGCMYNYMEG